MMPTRTAIGLDVGRYAVKVVCAEKRWRQVVLTRAELLKLPRSGNTLDIVRRWLESLGLQHRPCVVGISGRATILKFVELPAGDPRTLTQAANIEVRKFKELTSEDFVCDVIRLQPAGDARRGVLVIARPDALKPILRFPAELGLTTVDVTPVSAALYNAVARFEMEGDVPALCADIGHRGTDVSVGDRNGLLFMRQFELGVASFAEALAAEGQVSAAQAEEQLAGGDIDAGAEPALDPAFEAWIAEIKIGLSLYQDRFAQGAQPVGRLILSGGGAAIRGLPERIGAQLGVPVSAVERLPVGREAGPPGLFTVAAGLALRGLESDRTPVSLLPPSLKRAVTVRRERRYWPAAAAAGLLIVATALYGRHLSQVRAGQDQVLADAARRKTESLQKELARTLEDDRQLVKELSTVYDLAANRGVMLDLMGALADAKPPSDWIVDIADASLYTNGPYAAITKSPTNHITGVPQEPVAFRDFVVRGFTTEATFYFVRSMLNSLQRDPRVELADLLEELPATPAKPRDTQWDALSGTPFTIHVRVLGRALGEATNLPSAGPASSADARLLQDYLQREQPRHADLLARWEETKKSLSTFKALAKVFNIPAEEEAGLIDFRVALMETRKKLLGQAAQRGTGLPSDLGLKEAAERDKDVRQLLFELATIRKLAEVAVDLSVSEIGQIEPLPPIPHQFGEAPPYLEEYPVRIRLKCSYSALLALIEELGREAHFVVLKQVQMKKAALEPPDLLEVTLVVASLVFPEPAEPEAPAK
jgi:Tfp pilus assembly PilM family ATPase